MRGRWRGQEYEFVDGKWVRVPPPVPGTPAGDLQILRSAASARQRRGGRAAKKFVKKYPGNPALEEVMMTAAEAEIDRGRLWQAYDD